MSGAAVTKIQVGEGVKVVEVNDGTLRRTVFYAQRLKFSSKSLELSACSGRDYS